ncbi:hypothetical protein KIH86_06035 [Paenibacillus sp. HN-1]|uniref:hypothetical protein n=1 Tax=Paenibacillus TaxID=44249 RepID=UPI001CAA184B|nr:MULTISPECIES: hypothetical protein [Paenibacillus]MBY9078054.1 hypothetical protein [Paenibacillus sp. CGMCC 1.18879]MBY9083795.1 hypothetical protein [Paenibacillus sinensis]
MLELAPEDYYKVKPLLEGGHPYPEIISIIEHTNPGWIYIDQAPEPRSALVWSKGMQGFYLIGDHSNHTFISSLDKFISTDIELKMREQSLHHFEVSGHHNDWDYEALFPSRKLYPFEQLVFKSFNKPGEITKRVFNTINLKQPD